MATATAVIIAPVDPEVRVELTLTKDEALYLYEALRLTSPTCGDCPFDAGDPIWMVLRDELLAKGVDTGRSQGWVRYND